MPQSPSINAVVAGFGVAGRQFHCYLIGLVPALNLYGVVSRRPETGPAIEELGARRFARLEEALADERVDLVVLATPNDLHAPQALAALAAGKHVVTDKPMALSAGEARSMTAAAGRSGRLLTCFQNRRWDGDFLTVRKALAGGAVGELVSLETSWNDPRKPRTWRSEAARGGGRWIDLGSHLVDQVLQLAGAPVERVYAQFRSGVHDNDVEDHACCLLTFANGVLAQVTTSSVARVPKRRWFVAGSSGTLIQRGFDPQEEAMKAGDIDAARPSARNGASLFRDCGGETRQTEVEPVPGRWRSYYENVAAAVLGREEPAVTCESVCEVVRVLEAAAESAASGEAVTLS